jgi:superfamily II DNA or RNA helicase
MHSVPASASARAKSFPEYVQFQKTWRPYQARILDRLTEYIGDRRLHLVAAPGSGKTILGLEIIRRMNQPALVLAPTITIRDQWVDRLAGCFLTEGRALPPWVSVDIRNPGLLTVATYQALHSLCVAEGASRESISEDEESEIEEADFRESTESAKAQHFPEILKQVGVRTLVVDEAHHLRSEWWKTLTFVAGRLDHPTIVSLTATPPFDVSSFEWQRYEELCGPVDAEVSIPELVREGDLCPHQDYVYLSVPESEELKVIAEFRDGVESFVQRLLSNKPFADALGEHPWIAAPDEHIEAMLDDPEYLSSMVVFLNAAASKVPRAALEIMGLSRTKIPALSLEWLEVLLTRSLYADTQSFSTNEALLKSIRHDLLQLGAIERRKVTLRSPSNHLKLLTTSLTKLRSISSIISLEAEAQPDCLRAVILTDFIRKAQLPKAPGETPSFEDIGVVPIFETLRRARIPRVRLGVLSGSLVIVPATALTCVKNAARSLGMDPGDLIATAAPQDSEYLVLEIRGEYCRSIVRLVTSVFQSGGITVLIGTKSLLGEGWDAPCINTLVLASFVGSYVLSNQMRGRSIRVDPEHPGKTANIWHLVCVEPGSFGPGADYELLVRRCAAFAGVSSAAPVIENGTNRLGIGKPPFSHGQIDDLNRQTSARALDRPGLSRQWEEALKAGGATQMVDGVKMPNDSLPRGFVVTSTIAALFFQAAYLFVAVGGQLMRALGRVKPGNEQNWYHMILVMLGVAAVVSLPWACLATWRLLRHGTPERSIEQIGNAVLEALEYSGCIDRRAGDFRVYADRNDDGTVFCWIGGGTGREQSAFLEAMRQTLRSIENPRYLLARNRIWRIFREDYFAVPETLGRKKECAEYFAGRWRKLVGPVQLVFTRTPQGRRVLLRARSHSLAGAFQKRSERVSRWK